MLTLVSYMRETQASGRSSRVQPVRSRPWAAWRCSDSSGSGRASPGPKAWRRAPPGHPGQGGSQVRTVSKRSKGRGTSSSWPRPPAACPAGPARHRTRRGHALASVGRWPPPGASCRSRCRPAGPASPPGRSAIVAGGAEGVAQVAGSSPAASEASTVRSSRRSCLADDARGSARRRRPTWARGPHSSRKTRERDGSRRGGCAAVRPGAPSPAAGRDDRGQPGWL